LNKQTLTFTSWFKILSLYFFIAIAAVTISPWFGAVSISPQKVLSESFENQKKSIETTIFFQQRLPRVLLGFLVGAALGMAGAACQSLLRNPLATPYTLGIASAGTLAASIPLLWPILAITLGPFSSTQLFALVGGVGAMLFILVLVKSAKNVSTTFIILAGVALNLFCASALMFLRYLADPRHLVAIDRWVMGGLVTIGYWELLGILPFIFIGTFILIYNSHALNQMGFGKEIAGSRGVNTQKLLNVSLFGSVMLTTGAVAVAGPIGFVGLVIPHAVRFFSGADQRIVIPASALLSGALLVLCDTAARTIVAPTEIPVGIITACFGAPVFLFILIRRLKM